MKIKMNPIHTLLTDTMQVTAKTVFNAMNLLLTILTLPN